MKFLLAAQIICLGLQLTARAAEPVASDHRLPKDTLGYLTLRNVADFKAAWQKTQFGAFANSDEMAPFRQEVEKQLKSLGEQLEGDVGVNLEELLAIPQGEITFAVFQKPQEAISVLGMIDFGDKEEAVKKLLEKGVAALEKEGATRSEEEFEDTKLIVFKLKKEQDEDADKADKDDQSEDVPQTVVYFLKDTSLVVGNNLEAAKALLSRWDGKHSSTLADNEIYRHIIERCSEDTQEKGPLVKWYVDPMAIVKGALDAAHAEETAPQVNMFLGLLPTLGLDKLRGAGGTVDMASGGFDSVRRTMVYIEQPPTGLLNVFQFPAIGQAPPKWVPAAVTSYFSINWDIEKAYQAIETMVDTFQGPGALARMFDEFAKNPQTGNLHFKKDILDHISGKLHFIGYPQEGAAKDSEVDRFLLVAELKDGASMKRALAKIAAFPILAGKSREFQGETLYEIPTKSDEEADDKDEKGDKDEKKGEDKEAGTLGLSVSENRFLMASDVALLEQVLRGIGDQDALVDLPAFKKAAARFPTKTSSISFEKEDAMLKQVYDALRDNKLSGVLGDEVKLDFSKLPEFDSVKKHLPISGGYMQPLERGMLIVTFEVKGEGDDK